MNKQIIMIPEKAATPEVVKKFEDDGFEVLIDRCKPTLVLDVDGGSFSLKPGYSK